MESINNNTENIQFFEKYTCQEGLLPESLKRFYDDQDLILYGLVDLDSSFKFQEAWLILLKERIVLYKMTSEGYRQKSEILLSDVLEIDEKKSLSSSAYIFWGREQSAPLLTIRFTGRQKIIMGHIKYLIENSKESEGRIEISLNADNEYQKAVLKNLTDLKNKSSEHGGKTFFRLMKYLRPYRKDVILGSIGAILGNICALLPAYLTGLLLDDVIRPYQQGGLGEVFALKSAWNLVGLIFLVYLLKELFSFIRLNRMSIMGEGVAMDLRTELFSHLQSLGMDFFNKKQTGSIISRVSSDTDRIWDFVAFGIVEVGIALVTLVSLSLVLISLDLKLGLAMSLPVPILLLSIYFHGERIQKLFSRAWKKWSDLTNVLSDTIPGMQVVKAFNQEEKEIKRFDQSNDAVTGDFINIHRAWTKFWPLLMMGIHFILIAVWVMAVPRLIQGEGQENFLTLGTFVSFLLYMTMFAQPIEVIGQMSRMLNRALSSAYRIFDILDTKPTLKNGFLKVNEKSLVGNVEFKNVSFSYDGIRNVLHNIDFKVQAGEMIGLVGASGGGKSTITKLLARFYDVSAGKILVDGVNLADFEAGSYRRQVGMVLQEPYLFHGTILENIRYGLPEISLGKVIEAAKIANAHEFILGFPLGYETIIGERGHTLSGGERQRISIARAILHDPKILILDEATSAVDTETERKIQDALDKLIEGRTVFAVAHRLSTLRKADRIIVIEKGRIKEVGDHQTLLNKDDGVYKKLQTLQPELNSCYV